MQREYILYSILFEILLAYSHMKSSARRRATQYILISVLKMYLPTKPTFRRSSNNGILWEILWEASIKQTWKVWVDVEAEALCPLPTPFHFSHTLIWTFLFSLSRLTDPIPTTETSIAPRQRPKAGQTQPNPGILPIQPALTPRKRATVQPPPQAAGLYLDWFETQYTSLLFWTTEKSWKAWFALGLDSRGTQR